MVFFILLNYGDFLLTKIGCFRLTLFGDFLLTLTKEKIIEIIKEFKWNSFQILEDKKFVEFFDEEITSLLEETNYGIGFVISYYLEETKFNRHVFVPESFSVKKRIKLIVNYINSEKVDTNKLQLIVSAKSTKELPITPLIKQMADKRLDEFLKTNKASFIYKYGFSISFGEFEQEKNFFQKMENRNYNMM